MTQLVVVDQILIAEHDLIDTLPTSVATSCSISSWRRASRKHPAKRFTKAITRSVAPSNNAPASELIFSAIESGPPRTIEAVTAKVLLL
jgi:hypothetical protein